MTHICDDTAYPAAAMPDECTCGGEPMSDDTYQGHANRETWAAGLWLANTQELYNATLAAARSARAEGMAVATKYGLEVNADTGSAQFADYMSGGGLEEIAELLRLDPRNGTPEGMLRDIGSLWRIDWREIYASMLEIIEYETASA